MAYSFKRSFNAILVTSSTTAIAFLANALSDIRPIRAFGIFAAIIIPVNFLIVIIVMPPIQMIHDNYMKEQCKYGRLYQRLCRRDPNSGKEDSSQTKGSTKGGSSKTGSGSSIKVHPGYKDRQGKGKPSEPVTMGDDSKITRCMSGPFNGLIIWARYVIIVFFLLLGIAGIITASYIGPLTEDQ